MPTPVTEPEFVESFFRISEPRSLKNIITQLLPFGTACAEHVILSAGLDPKQRFPYTDGTTIDRDELMEDPKMQCLLKEIKGIEQWFHNCHANSSTGFILLAGLVNKICIGLLNLFLETKPSGEQGSEGESAAEVYQECEPFLLYQHQNRPHKAFETFDQALDEFYSKVLSSLMPEISSCCHIAERRTEVSSGRDSCTAGS